MATVAITPVMETNDGEARIVLWDVDWDTYEMILSVVGDGHVRLTYDDGSLELMSPSFRHEWYARLFEQVVRQVTMVFRLPIKGAGSTTFKREGMRKGVEPDASFYLASAPRFRGKMIDPKVDPPPDLVIEIEITHSAVDSLLIYAAMGVPEVWHCDGRTLRFLQLQPEGTYVESATSPNLPMLTPEEVFAWIGRAETLDETEWLARLQDWVRDELVPRHQGG